MTTKRILQARDIVNDIRDGMTDTELMNKYGLSARGLESAFNQLLNNGIVSRSEVYERGPSGDDAVVIDESRSLPRHRPVVTIPIHDVSTGDTAGKLDNINERGIGVSGIEAQISETKSFFIPAAQVFSGAEDIRFEARCVWVEPHLEPELVLSGYQITNISSENTANLVKFIEFVISGD